MFLLQIWKYADQECISVPNNGGFNYTLEHIAIWANIQTKELLSALEPQRMTFFFLAIYIISVYLETELYWHGIANADQMNKPDQWIRRKI